MEWRNRGKVWDKMAKEWAGAEEWMRTQNVKNTLDVKYRFVIFVLDRMKLSTAHRKKKSQGIGNKVKNKTPRDSGPADTTIHTRVGGPTVQLCGDKKCGVHMDQW